MLDTNSHGGNLTILVAVLQLKNELTTAKTLHDKVAIQDRLVTLYDILNLNALLEASTLASMHQIKKDANSSMR